MWLAASLGAAVLFSVASFIDEELLSVRLAGFSVTLLTVVASLSGAPLLLGLGIVGASTGSLPGPSSALAGLVAGWLVIAGFQCYYKALERSSAFVAGSLFQLVVPFNYVFGRVFFDERLSTDEVIGVALILCGSMALSYERTSADQVRSLSVFYWMCGASSLISISDVTFKSASIEDGFLPPAIAEYSASVLAGLVILLVGRRVRDEARSLLRRREAASVGVPAHVNEVVVLAGTLLLRYAITSASLVVVQAVLASQPLIMLAIATALTHIRPLSLAPGLHSNSRAFNLVCTALIVCGGVALA